MKPAEYIDAALVTESINTKDWRVSIPTPVFRLNHAILGLASEVEECLQACQTNNYQGGLLEEVGDLYWYLAILAATTMRREAFVSAAAAVEERPDSIDFVAKSPDDPYAQEMAASCAVGVHLMRISCSVGILADLMKRVMAYGTEVDIGAFGAQVEPLGNAIGTLCWLAGRPPRVVRYANIAKLAARFPDKFKEHDAINRNLEQEAKVLVEYLDE